MKQRKIVIPHEHGGWAMISVPFLLGMFAAEAQGMHLAMFAAWLLLYLSSYPFLQSIKRSANKSYWIKWGSLYGAAALVCLIPPLIDTPLLFYFGIPLCLLLLVNVWHTKHKAERALVNDMCAILIFSFGGAAAYLLGGGGWDRTMAAIVLLSFLYFMGSAFFVKSVFRERMNKRWTTYARAYHLIVLAVPWAIGLPWLTLPFVFSAVRAFVYGGKAMRPMKVGIIEIVGSVQFLALSALLIE
ncbi:YwiC-like family protein [Cohnella panacarvi]|uniref:YwiC-like family protein n=1 Tax=Cohnella panacarvi TaxID=400776 RepID=UPI000479189D|nr:YwiC-like family protein [Cohnella panacarvi]